VQPAIPNAMSAPTALRAGPAAPDGADPAHDEMLLVAALERIQATRQVLEELLSAELSALLFA
jgi:hypothetical protein